MVNSEKTANMLRRRRKTKAQIMKEAYLPYIFLLVTLVLVIVFIVGALL